MKKLLVLSAVLYAGNSMAMWKSSWDIVTGAICAATGGPVGIAVGAIEMARGAEGMLYEDLQEGKAMLQQKGEEHDWDDDQKHKANIAYKEICPFLHRANSPDVFPGY